MYCIIYCIRIKCQSPFQRDPKRQRTQEHRSLLPSHMAVLSEQCRSWADLLCTRLRVLVFLSSCPPGDPPEGALSSSAGSEVSPGHMGKCTRDRVASINFVLSKWCGCHTHHSRSHSVFENLVLRPHLVSREIRKRNLGVGWAYAQKKRRVDFGQQWIVSTMNMIK